MQDRSDALGKTVASGDEIAGDDDEIGFQLVDPADELHEVSSPDDRAVMEVGNLNDLHSDESGVEVSQRHGVSLDVDPSTVDRERVKTGKAEAGHQIVDGLPPTMLATPFGGFEILFDAIHSVARASRASLLAAIYMQKNASETLALRLYPSMSNAAWSSLRAWASPTRSAAVMPCE